MLAWKIVLTILYFFALITGAIRIFQRWRTKLLWWDDYLVVFPCILDLIGVVTFWLQPTVPLVVGGVKAFIFSSWTFTFLCLSVIWLSRICLTLSLARIYLPGHPYRRLALSFCVILVILYFTCVFVTTFRCPGARGSWYIINVQTCASSSVIIGTPVTLFALDLSSDIFLVAIPLTTLWKIRLPKIERLLVLSFFSSSALTLAVTVVYFALYKAQAPRFNSDLLGMSRLQASASLLACNLLVVTMLAYKFIRRRRRRTRSPSPPTPSPQQQPQPQPQPQLDQGPPPQATVTSPSDPSEAPSARPKTATHVSFTVISTREFEAYLTDDEEEDNDSYPESLWMHSLPTNLNNAPQKKAEMFLSSSPFP